MPTKKIAVSTLWQLSSQIAMAALSILTVKFVTISLSRELVGIYNSAYGYLQLFGILADFGLYAVAVREVARNEQREEVLGALIVLRTIILLLSLGAALLVVWGLPLWRGTPLPLSVTIAALVPFFTLLAGILRTVFQVEYRMHYVFAAEVTQRIITAGLIGVFVLLGVRGSSDLHTLHLFLFVGGIGAFALFLISMAAGSRLLSPQFPRDRRMIPMLLRRSAPYGLAFLCTALYRQCDVTLIALLRPDFDLQNAYYGTVVRMADMGFLLPTFLLNSMLPTLSEHDARGRDSADLLGRTLTIIILLGMVAGLFSLLWPRPLVALLTTESYLSTPETPGSDAALRLLSLPLFLNGFVLYGFYVLLARHAWRPLVSCLLAGATLSLLLNVALIPNYGFVGAAWTSIATHTVLAALLLPRGLRAAPARIPPGMPTRLLALGLLLAFALALARPFLTSTVITASALLASGFLLVGLLRVLGFWSLLSEERPL